MSQKTRKHKSKPSIKALKQKIINTSIVVAGVVFTSVFAYFLVTYNENGNRSAAQTESLYPYGDYNFGDEVWLQGDFSFSGLSENEGRKGRPAKVLRHDTRLHNVGDGKETPYYQTVQFDIKETLPSDNFVDRSGYHLIPVEPKIIKDFAAKSNGNPEFVWAALNDKNKIDMPQLRDLVRLYTVNGQKWVNVAAVVMLSGGGPAKMMPAGGNGITSPVFQTTYITTPWPEIIDAKITNGDTLKTN
jgi:hypothetical protein